MQGITKLLERSIADLKQKSPPAADQDRLAQALHESEEQLLKIYRASPNVLVISRLSDGRVLDVNDSFLRSTGYTREETVGRTAVEMGFWANAAERKRLIGVLREEGSFSNEEGEFITKSGEVRTALLSAEMCGIGGDTCMIFIANDITERKRAESALRESEEKYRDLFENTSELIQSVTPEGYFRYVNNGWKDTLGYSDAEVAAMTLFDIVHPDHVDHCRSIFARLARGEEVGMVETVLVARSGEKVNIEGNVTCKMENGRPLYTRGIFRDVTKRKHLEENVYRLASAVSMSTDCILITDFDAKIIDVNQRTLELFGFSTKQEMLGRHFLELIDPAERVTANMDVKEIIERGQLENREYGMVARDERRFTLQVSTSLVKDADGQPMGIVRVGREIFH